MKAYLIDPVTQFIRATKVESLEDIKQLIGFDSVNFDVIDDVGDRLYFDDEADSRGNESRFQIDNVITVVGKGVIVGTTDDGETLCDANIDMYGLNRRLKYL